MQWENPQWLLALWIVLPLAGLLVYAGRRRAAAAHRFVDPKMVERLMPVLGGSRPWIKGTLWLVGVAMLIVAVAGPRFGVYFEKVTARGVDLFVLLDVSRSMLAEDVAPNRLERAKSDVRDLLMKLQSDRVGLIAFAGAAVVKVPLTTDQGFFLTALNEIDPTSAPRGGSLIGDAIRKAIESMQQRLDRDQVIVLITDGEDHDSFPSEAAQQAAERHIKFITVGLGDSNDGMRIPIRDEAGQLRYLKHDGQEIWSRMDERLLKEIALTTGGAYIPAKTRAYDLGQIYEDHLAGLHRGEIQSEKRKQYAERFQLFACLGLGLLVVETLISRYPRPLTSPAMRVLERQTSGPPPAASTALRTSLILLCGLFPALALASSNSASRHVQEGIRHFTNEAYKAAEKAFAEADVALPENPKIAFNQACALAAQNDVDKAIELFQQATLSQDEQIVASAHYNVGCLIAAQGKAAFGESPEDAPPEARQAGLDLLLQASGHYRDCLRADEGHAGARHNLEVLRMWIKRMQDVWAQRDREKQREEMNLLQFLEMLHAQQQTLRQATRSLQREDDSPRRRQAMSQTESAQRLLVEETEPLKEKIQQTLQPPSGPQAAPAAATAQVPEMEKAIEVLTGVAERAGKSMTEAANRLADTLVDEAIDSQAAALDSLNDIYTMIAPFTNLLAKATGVQQGLVDQSSTIAEPSSDEDADENDQSHPGYSEMARDQTLVSGWSQALPIKAEQELKQLEAQTTDAPPSSNDPNADPQQQQELQEGLKTSLQKAVETGPQIEQFSIAATGHLENNDISAALPDQQEALKLLKEIAETLSKQEQNQDQNQENDQNQDQENDQNQEKGEQNQENKDENQQDQQQNQANDQQQRQQQDVSQRQAETLMRKVRERERDYRQRQKQLQGYIGGGTKVDKDW